MMQRNVHWSLWVAVAVLALFTGAAQCGHNSASDESTSSEAEESTDDGAASDEGGTRKAEGDEQMLQSDEATVENPDVEREALEKLVEDNTAFGFELYRTLVDSKSKNLVFAPYNLSHVLAMVLPGAEGTTEQEMRKALQFRLEEPKLHAAFNMLDGAIQSAKGTRNRRESGETGKDSGGDTDRTVRTASGVWMQRGFPVREPFLDTLSRYYGAGVRPVDFKGAAEKARGRINEWAANETGGKIEDLLPSGSVDNRTRMILTAAIYFRAQWAESFDSEQTKKAEFRSLSGKTSQVEMMHQRLRSGYKYTEGSNYRAVELPYATGAYSMVVIVPDEGAFEKVESKLDSSFIGGIFDGLERGAVDLAVPKFELRAGFSAGSALRKLGMKSAFTKSANFDGVTGERELVLDDVIHKTFVSVDEKGTEAAAASAATMRATSAPMEEPDYKKVTVDRPFLFAIRHTGTGAVLFVGRVVSL